MKNIKENECVAQGAAIWNESETHEQIMKALSGVQGHIDSYVYINGNCYYWSTSPLDEKAALFIAERGHHDEIMYMIHQYGKAKCPADKRSFCDHVYDCLLPGSVQKILAERNNREETDAYLSYQGFEREGQDVVLNRGDHDEIMRYLKQHGFQAAQQRRLKQRGNKDEIALHIAQHDWAYELLDEIFDKLEAGCPDDFDEYITLRELPVPYQKRMLRVAGAVQFKVYIDRYGLWNETHADLVEYRLLSEVRCYLTRHPYLCDAGEKKLAEKGMPSDKAFYIACKKGSINSFLWILLRMRPLDYDLLTSCFLKISCPYYENEADIELMKKGSHEAVMARISTGKLGNRALTALFFRNNSKEFEAYLDQWEK